MIPFLTQFELRQTKKVIVHDLTKMSLESFTTIILNNNRFNCMWTEGIVMYVIPSPNTDAMIEAARDGTEEHILSVIWAELPKYQEELKGNKNLIVSVTNAPSKFISGLAKWIKEDTFV